MSDQFVGEIRMFPFTFAPRSWAQCDGQILPLTQNIALFSLLGTNYGGDGSSTFALPDLQGSVALHAGGGQGAGLQPYFVGQQSGVETVALIPSEMPLHGHVASASSSTANLNAPSPVRSMARSRGGVAYHSIAAPLAPMSIQTLSVAGASTPHNNMMPYLTIGFCIALQGIFPARP